jgi:hypothetical protein
MFENTILKLQ